MFLCKKAKVYVTYLTKWFKYFILMEDFSVIFDNVYDSKCLFEYSTQNKKYEGNSLNLDTSLVVGAILDSCIFR